MRLSESQLKRIIREELAKTKQSKKPISKPQINEADWRDGLPVDWRSRIIDAVDMGLLSWEVVAKECLSAMSQREARAIAGVFELDNEENDW